MVEAAAVGGGATLALLGCLGLPGSRARRAHRLAPAGRALRFGARPWPNASRPRSRPPPGRRGWPCSPRWPTTAPAAGSATRSDRTPPGSRFGWCAIPSSSTACSAGERVPDSCRSSWGVGHEPAGSAGAGRGPAATHWLARGGGQSSSRPCPPRLVGDRGWHREAGRPHRHRPRGRPGAAPRVAIHDRLDGNGDVTQDRREDAGPERGSGSVPPQRDPLAQ